MILKKVIPLLLFLILSVPVMAKAPEIEVVFCLDTTGSMGGLIEGAKKKIFSIGSQMAGGSPAPQIKIGLIPYRDKGDDYITKVFPLNDDIDEVFSNLTSFQAGGGGDAPEHVNQALADALAKIKWSPRKETLKMIFLVGDCPPHTDYRDSKTYQEIAKLAVKREIIINTIQCGNYKDTEKYWKEIARLSEGTYVKIPQGGGMASIATPVDEELARLNLKLEETVIAFGEKKDKDRSLALKESLKLMAPAVAAERAEYKSSSSHMASYDLINAIKDKRISLKNIKKETLPSVMQKMTLTEKKAYLKEKETQRERIKEKIKALNKKRIAYINQKLKESPLAGDSFDKAIKRIIKKEGKRKGILY